MNIADFDYDLPEHLIAQEPLAKRDNSRLLIVDKNTGQTGHGIFSDLKQYLKQDDLLVINDTKVLPARLYAQKISGAKVEILLLKQVGLNTWQAMVRPGRKLPIGSRLIFDIPALRATIIDMAEEGTRIIEFAFEGDFYNLLEILGRMPLPPYIKKELADQDRYQPIYAQERGSAAAPTAGLHFTEPLMAELAAYGIEFARLVLHVGLGTFRPVKVENIKDHYMHKEYYRLDAANAAKIKAAKEAGRRIIAVGTTSVRTLETIADQYGQIMAGEGQTEAFIYPGYQFKAIDGMITNFHLPKSTLLMLVSALAGRENILNAYQEAIAQEYRFFSFGDAMLII